jgi:imidazolonepropionase-like amidohydrolase
MKLIISIILFALYSIPTFSQTQPTIFLNAKIYPISGEPIENGYLVIHKGKITEVGSMENFPL